MTLSDIFFRTLHCSYGSKIKAMRWLGSDKLEDKMNVCSPSATPWVEKSIEEYDVTTKPFQDLSDILEGRK